MKSIILTGLIAASIAAPASAAVLISGASNVATQPFALIAGTQGVMLASTSVSGTALTFSATVRSAVYRNSLGTLDFYYQVVRTGFGSRTRNNNHSIEHLTASDFTGFFIDGYESIPDPDGAGFFTAMNNPGASTTTFARSGDGSVPQISLGSNVLSAMQVSATYVFRTNARRYESGTFGVINGSALQGLAFEPAAVPEPKSWALLVIGFGMMGAAMRRQATIARA